MDFFLQPWSWYVSGTAIAFILFLVNYFGKGFGISTNLETMCTIMGAGKVSEYFKKDWKERSWALVMIVGLLIGGFISSNFLSTNTINLNPVTVQELADLGFQNAGKSSIVPAEIFSMDSLLSVKGFLILIMAGVCIGFGTRYAGGCTSGHAITGLSSFQLPSLIAVIGFFAGGLIMTWVLFPLIFG